VISVAILIIGFLGWIRQQIAQHQPPPAPPPRPPRPPRGEDRVQDEIEIFLQEVGSRRQPPRRRDDGFYLVPVEVAIPLAGVTLVPQDGFYHGRLSVVTAVIDREGGTSPPDPIEIPLTVPAAEIDRARTQHFTYAAELLMRPGLHEVAVGLRDELAGESSFVREVVRVGG
jgi:hypothetical protein